MLKVQLVDLSLSHVISEGGKAKEYSPLYTHSADSFDMSFSSYIDSLRREVDDLEESLYFYTPGEDLSAYFTTDGETDYISAPRLLTIDIPDDMIQLALDYKPLNEVTPIDFFNMYMHFDCHGEYDEIDYTTVKKMYRSKWEEANVYINELREDMEQAYIDYCTI